jgi:pilus assembly protein Flp/PilA
MAPDLRDRGASAVEYGLMVAAIAAVIVAAVFALGGIVQSVFVTTCDEIHTETQTTANCP